MQETGPWAGLTSGSSPDCGGRRTTFGGSTHPNYLSMEAQRTGVFTGIG